MKKLALALALALTLTGTLTACGRTDTVKGVDPMTGNPIVGKVNRSSEPNRTGKAWDYLDDARYTAGSNGKVYGNDGNPITRDLTQGARDMVRGAGDAVGDVGRGVGNAVGDVGRGVGDAARDIGSGVGNAMNDMGKDMTGQAKTY